jgi:hypothetical protein
MALPSFGVLYGLTNTATTLASTASTWRRWPSDPAPGGPLTEARRREIRSPRPPAAVEGGGNLRRGFSTSFEADGGT